MPDLDLPIPGVTPGTEWASKNNAALNALNAVMETGRLSEEGLQDQLVEIAADLNPEALSDAFIALRIGDQASQTSQELEGSYGAPAILNPETPIYGAVSQVAVDSIGGVEGLARIFDGALTNINVERPNVSSSLIWEIWAGSITPPNLDPSKGDTPLYVDNTAEEDKPGWADSFSGPAGPLGVAYGGMKTWEFATRTGLGGTTWSRDGSGNAGLTAGSGGNSTAVANGLTGKGKLTVELGTVTAGNAGGVFRYVDNQNYCFWYRLNSTNPRLALFQVVSGTASQITNSTAPTGFDIVSNAVVELIDDPAAGNVIVLINGVSALNLNGVTANATGTKSGLYASPSAGMPNYFAKSARFEAS